MSRLKLRVNDKKEGADLQKEFLSKLTKLEKNILGYESYGDFSEFYDEDGVVLLGVYPDKKKDENLVFKFMEDESEYSLKIEDSRFRI